MPLPVDDAPQPEVGDAVELVEVTGDWEPGTTGIVLRRLRTHLLIAVLDELGRQVETVPVGYRSVTPRGGGAPAGPLRRRAPTLAL